MSGSHNISIPFSLPEDQHCHGYENFASWKTLMIAHGKPQGYLKYWEDKIIIPQEILDAENPSTQPKTSPPDSTTNKPSGPTPVHSTTPSELEYELCESAAMSSILINLVDIAGSGVDPNGKSHEVWALLAKQYGGAIDRARNMQEKALANCNFEEGMKVAGENSHIKKMRTLRKAANDAGAGITDICFITKLLDSFPESWDPIILNLYDKMDLSEVIMKLTSHGERLAN